MDIFQWFPQRLRERREAAGFTQRAAAEALKVAPSYISNLENGENKPNILNIVANLADLYDTGLEHLFGRTDDPRRPKIQPEFSLFADRLRALTENLPEHRIGDLVVIAEVLLLQERKRYAFWQITICEDCKKAMVGGIAESGEIFYRHESPTCAPQFIEEQPLINAVVETATWLLREAKQENNHEDVTFFRTLQKLASQLSLTKKHTQPSDDQTLDLVRRVLEYPDRSVPQAWMYPLLKIHVRNGEVETVKLT